MSRGLTFGAVAQMYERTRPGYPTQLAEEVMGLLPGRRVVEVGAGTGKATRLFANRDVELTCLEPDPDMALVLRERCRALARVTVVEVAFEAWMPEPGSYDGLVSAQAWHWMDEATRMQRAARVLRAGGILALFWNVDEWGSEAVHREIDEIYASHELYGADRPMLIAGGPGVWPADRLVGEELAACASFEYLGVRSYPWCQEYGARDFADYLNTTSHHRILAAEVRKRLSADLGDAVTRHGGRIALDRRTDLFLARCIGQRDAA